MALARFKNSYRDEKPAHEVTLTKPYYIGTFEVTQEQYQQVMGSNPSRFSGRDLPVERVSWKDVQSFCTKVSSTRDFTIRLPTEVEWERACRAGTKTTYYMGDSETDLDRAGWHKKNSNKTTHPVGGKVPNAWGVHDMHGNHWEWCADWYGPYKAEATVDPQSPTEGKVRVLRGGSWNFVPRNCCSTSRNGCAPVFGVVDYGFRVVLSLPKTP